MYLESFFISVITLLTEGISLGAVFSMIRLKLIMINFFKFLLFI